MPKKIKKRVTKKVTKKKYKKTNKIKREIAPRNLQKHITKIQIYKPVRGPPSKEI